jgi:small redox-active disulfide protein 2
MKNIKILGTGCPKCKRTIELVQEAVNETGVEATIEKVDDIMDIMKYDVMSTPAIVINDVIAIKGRVPSKSEVVDLIQS